MPLANALIAESDLARPEPRYPLDLAVCPACALVQITETVPPEVLFRDYLYFSSFSETMLAHARTLVERLVVERQLGQGSLVIEVASNDGYLLQFYKAAGVPVLGIEPARNVAEIARRDRGIPTLAEFFGLAVAEGLVAEGRRADVIHAHNVLAHVADLFGFVEGLCALLAPGGIAVIEVPYVKDMVDRCEFDTIYHEHLCYFSLTSASRLFSRHGLEVKHVERLPIHGGSLRLFVGRPREGETSAAVAALLAEEAAWGADQVKAYRGFAHRVEGLERDLRILLGDLKRQGKSIAAYGAAAKGATLLNAVGIGAETLDFVADRSPHKQGRFLPGARVPVRPPEALLESQPDYVLLLAWNLADEVLTQQDEYRRRGGRFIVPVPEVRIL
jgi:SAM-dependent methyltransferase